MSGNLDLFQFEPKDEIEVYRTYDRTPQTFEEDVKAVKAWLELQKHLPETPPDALIRSFLRGSKCSVERTKQRIDMYYTLRSVFREIFQNPLSKDVQEQVKYFYYVPLPKITKDLYRVFCFRFKENCPETWDIEKVLSYFTNGVYETKILEDIALGNIFIVDCTNISLGHVTRITPTLIKKLNTLTEKVYNDRQKATHLIYNGTGADILMAMLKSAMRAKVRERVFMHKSFETLHEHFPKEMLPKDYGGEEKSFDELSELVQKNLAKHKERFDKLDTLKTNESLRPGKPVNDEFLGFYGNFKKLQVD